MRVKLLVALFFMIWVGLLVRIYYLSVHSNEHYEQLSDKNTIKSEYTLPVRGTIFDRKGRPLAINKLGFKIVVKPHLSRKKYLPVLRKELRKISELFSLDYEKMLKIYKRKDSYYNHHYIAVVDFIEYERMMPLFSKLNLDRYLKIIPASRRFYPYKETAAHIVGYMSHVTKKDVKRDPLLKLIGFVGKSGVEKYYNAYLQGKPGERVVKVNALNEQIELIDTTQPDENHDLTLNIDIELQRYTAELFKGKSGAVIVMGIDGAIVAAGSYPEYDLNTFATGISKSDWLTLINDIDAPFTNKITNGLYPPGSVIKTGLGLIYIASKLSPWSTFFCNGSMELGNRNFRCWKSTGHLKTDIIKAIRESCDDYFYKGSLKVGIEYMARRLEAFGLGKKTGVDIPNEFIGTVPSRSWKMRKYGQPWYRGETLNTSIGQGSFLVTPLQIAQFTALMATGRSVTPHVAKSLGEDPIKAISKEVLQSKEKRYLPIIQKAMRQVCSHPKGTATNHIRSKVKIAGKTGTAQVVGISQETKKRLKEHEMEYYRRSHAWLTTYAPYKNPQYIVTVLVEHGGHGGSAAGAIVSKIYDKLLELGYIKR